MTTFRYTILCLIALGMTPPLAAQSDGPRDVAFGFSGMTYLFEPEDAVFTDADEHLNGNFGFRLTKAWFGDRTWGLMVDTELYLGVASRMVLDVDMPNTIFGVHAYAGPVVSFGGFQSYAAFGVNRTSVGESDIIEVPGPILITHVAGGGINQAWSDIMTARAREANQGSNVIASVPRYYELATAGLFGLSYDFGSGSGGFRIAFDYVPIFVGPTRNNYRVTFSLAG